MAVDANTITAVVGAAAENVQFAVEANNVPSKCLIVATYDEATKTTITQNTLYQITSPEDAGDKFGFGFGPNYLARWLWKGHNGAIPTYVIPVDQDAGAAAATGDVTITATSASSGFIYLYIAGELVQVTVSKGDDGDAIAITMAAKINANTNLPVTAAVNGVTLNQVDITAKDLNLGTDDITLSVNEKLGEVSADGVTAIAFTAMNGGAGVMDSDMAAALNALGINDDQNELYFTHIMHGFGDTSAVLDDISEYNGEGNLNEGNWADTVHRPFVSFCGDVVAGSSGLTAAKALGNGRKLDRTNGQISVPGSPNHPDAIAAVAMGVMARVQQERAAQNMIGQVLSGVLPGVSSDRWTNDTSSLNDALLAGVSGTKYKNGAVYMLNVATFYHPDSVPVNNNGYRSMVSISKVRNMTHNIWINFEGVKWQGTIIVQDKTAVSNAIDNEKARDRKDALGDCLALADAFAGKAWIYTADFTKTRLSSDATLVTVRPGADGFNIKLPVILSGEGNVFDTVTQFDTSLTVLTQ